MPAKQKGPVKLWEVHAERGRANERVIGVTPANPIRIAPHYDRAIFHVRIVSETAPIFLIAFRVYGALTPTHPPAVGAAFEGLIQVQGLKPLGAGYLRVAHNRADVAVGSTPREQPGVIPPYLWVEYTTIGFPIGGASRRVDVYGTFIAPAVAGAA
jgi:hypothetical protein